MNDQRDQYQKCLELLREQWPDHISFIQEASTGHLTFVKTEAGETNILCSVNGVQFTFHSQAGALKESELFFESLHLKKGLKTIFHYGLGAGYDFLAARQWLEEDPERLMIILEDDFGVIKLFFETSLAYEMLMHPQVLLVPIESDTESLKVSYPAGFEMLLHIGIRDNYRITISEAYQRQRPSFSRTLAQSIHVRIQDFVWLFAFSDSERIKELIDNLAHNLLALPTMLRGRDLFKQFEGIPALICAAGPSIKDQLPYIKKLKNRALLFGAGTGMNVLNSEGILPHFGCGIDPNKTSESRMLMNTAFTVPYFQTVHFNAPAANLIHAHRLFFRGSESYGAVNWIMTRLGVEEKKVHFNISTTCACLSLAKHMECDPIVFLGLDLSYTEKKRYPEGVTAHPTDKKIESRFIEELPRDRIIPAVNSLGKRIFTRSDWINEGAYYSLYARQHPDLKLINGTVEGLAIAQTESLPLEMIEKRYLTRSYDLDNWTYTEVMLASPLSVDHSRVQAVVNEWKESLEAGERLLKEMILDLLEADDQITDFPDHIGTEKYRKLQKELEEEPIYHYLIKEMDFAFEKKKMRDMLLLRFHSHLLEKEERYKKMLLTELYRLKYLHKYVEIQLKGIKKINWEQPYKVSLNEGGECEVPIPDSGAVLKNGLLKIQQNELGIDLEDHFSPKSLGDNPDKRCAWASASNEDGVLDGECRLYDKEGWLKGRCYYKKGLLHGPSTFYGPKGNTLASGWFFNDERQGVNLQYYLSGKVFSIQRFKNNLPHGRQEYFEENGQLKTLCPYEHGLLHGNVELFYADGKKKRTIGFSKGQRHGIERLWSADGIMIRESEFENGRPKGIARRWYADGQLKSEKKIVDAEGNYDLRKWSKEGKMILEKIYIPKNLSEEITQSQAERSRSLDLLKKKMEGLVNDKDT